MHFDPSARTVISSALDVVKNLSTVVTSSGSSRQQRNFSGQLRGRLHHDRRPSTQDPPFDFIKPGNPEREPPSPSGIGCDSCEWCQRISQIVETNSGSTKRETSYFVGDGTMDQAPASQASRSKSVARWAGSPVELALMNRETFKHRTDSRSDRQPKTYQPRSAASRCQGEKSNNASLPSRRAVSYRHVTRVFSNMACCNAWNTGAAASGSSALGASRTVIRPRNFSATSRAASLDCSAKRRTARSAASRYRHLPLAGDFFHQDPQRANRRPRDLGPKTAPPLRSRTPQLASSFDRNSRDFHGIHIAENGSLRHLQFCRQFGGAKPRTSLNHAIKRSSRISRFPPSDSPSPLGMWRVYDPTLFAPSTYHSSRVRTEGFWNLGHAPLGVCPGGFGANQLTANHSGGGFCPWSQPTERYESSPIAHGQSGGRHAPSDA